MKIKKISTDVLEKVSFNIFTWVPKEEALYYCCPENDFRIHARINDCDPVKFPKISFSKPFYKSHSFLLSKKSLMILYKGNPPKDHQLFKTAFLRRIFPKSSIKVETWWSFIDDQPIVFFIRPDFNTIIIILFNYCQEPERTISEFSKELYKSQRSKNEKHMHS